MRRPLAALVLGAVSLAGLVPVAGAAGAAELPKFPFFQPQARPQARLRRRAGRRRCPGRLLLLVDPDVTDGRRRRQPHPLRVPARPDRRR